jgi:nicotinamide-nucleotide amidase
VAESCTGGLLGSTFTDVPGASEVFQGGIVAYHQDVKIEHLDVPEIIIQQHGAVSAETAVAMATGVAEKFSADYGLSTTGFAGPGGGTPEDPVGTVYIGLHSPFGAWSHRVHINGGRNVVRQRAVHTASDWLRRKLLKYQLEEAMSTLIYSMGAGI